MMKGRSSSSTHSDSFPNQNSQSNLKETRLEASEKLKFRMKNVAEREKALRLSFFLLFQCFCGREVKHKEKFSPPTQQHDFYFSILLSLSPTFLTPKKKFPTRIIQIVEMFISLHFHEISSR